MMVGLPSCGKTTWANKYSVEHPEKKYNVLGTNSLIERMKVSFRVELMMVWNETFTRGVVLRSWAWPRSATTTDAGKFSSTSATSV